MSMPVDPLQEFHDYLLQKMETLKNMKSDTPVREMVHDCSYNLLQHKSTFTLLNLVQSSYIEDVLEYVQSNPEKYLDLQKLKNVNYPSVPELNYTKTERYQQSLNSIIQVAIYNLRNNPVTRDQLCQLTGLDRRRLSSALSPLTTLAVIVEPEAMKIGQYNKLVVRQRMPGVRLFRNARQEAVICQIDRFIEYFKLIRKLRQLLEEDARGQNISVPTMDVRFIGRRIDELTKKKQQQQ